MGEFVKTMLGKLTLGVLSITAALIWFSWSDGGRGNYENKHALPEQVLGGGGGELRLQYEVNQPASLTASFSRWDADDNEREVRVDQEILPGSHVQSVDVAEDTYVYIELKISDPEVGAEIDWNVFYNDQRVYEEQVELEQPLESGYAFFVQFEVDRVGAIEGWRDSR